MKSYHLGLYEKSMPGTLNLPEKLKEAKAAGYDYLELSIDETDEKLSRLNWSCNEIRNLRFAMEESGIPIKSICLSAHRRFPLGDPDPEIRHRSLIIMEQAILLAVKLGIRIIQISGYDVYYKPSTNETQKLFGESLEQSVRLAAREGVILAFETMETPFMDTVEKAMFYVSDINTPFLQVYPDLGNLTNAALIYGHDFVCDMLTGGGHIAALHLKETLPGIYRDVPYGTGHVDFASGVRTAFQLGVRRFVGEFWDNGDYQAQISHAHTFLRGFLDEAAMEVY